MLQMTWIYAPNHAVLLHLEELGKAIFSCENAHNVILVTLNRISFISYKVDSVESFYANFSKVYEAVTKVLSPLTITRIGCRIIGTYKTKSCDFKNVLKNFQDSFPAKNLF